MTPSRNEENDSQVLGPYRPANAKAGGFMSRLMNKIKNVVGAGSEHTIVTYDKESDRYGLRYTELIGPIVKSIQELVRSVKSNHQEVQALKQENEALKNYLCSKDPSAPFCKSH